MIELFKSLGVGHVVSFQVTDYNAQAECVYASPDWLILKRLNGPGYYDIFFEGESVKYRWHEVVH